MSNPKFADLSGCTNLDPSNLPVRITDAIIASASSVGLSTISPSSLTEWLYRLNALFDAGIFFLFTSTPEGNVPLRFHPNDLVSHLHIRFLFPITPLSDSDFDIAVANIRRANLAPLFKDHTA